MMLTGGQIVCESLIREGVEVIFGIPGGAILPLYQDLPDYPQLRHILMRHEQGAAHAADGYARVTGRVGVAFGTSGPGATNLVTGIATAQMDSVPTVFITGQVARDAIGKDAFQETDVTGITLPITKTQLPGHERLGDRRDHQGGLLRGQHWQAGAGAGGYPQGRVRRAVPSSSTRMRWTCPTTILPRGPTRRWFERPPD